jgi:3',5'-cyclic AMP phosphodiesterase CpdA
MSEISKNHLRIVLIGDPQLGFTDSRNESRAAEKFGLPEPLVTRYYSTIDRMYYEAAVAKIKQLDPAPDAVLVAGDLVDSADCREQWEDYTSVTTSLGLPVYEAMGNHDGFTKEGLDTYRNVLGKQDYYSFKIKGAFFLVLNSNYLKNCDILPKEARLHQAFVERELRESSAARTKIMLMHHPLYFEDPDEEEAYFSLPPAQRMWVLGLIEKYQVRAVLSGHYHRNHIIQYKRTALITSGSTSEAMGYDHDGKKAERGFRILDLNLDTGEINHEYIQLGLIKKAARYRIIKDR